MSPYFDFSSVVGRELKAENIYIVSKELKIKKWQGSLVWESLKVNWDIIIKAWNDQWSWWVWANSKGNGDFWMCIAFIVVMLEAEDVLGVRYDA